MHASKSKLIIHNNAYASKSGRQGVVVSWAVEQFLPY